MRIRLHHWSRAVALAGCLAVVAAGCRTYGEYDNQDKTLKAIHVALEESEAELEQFRGELRALQLEIPETSPLYEYVRELQIVVDAHEAMLTEHVEMAAALEPGGWYRPANRVFGTIVAEQAILRQRYAELMLAVGDPQDLLENPPRLAALPDEGRYYIAPPFYERIIGEARPPLINEIIGGHPGPAQTDSLEDLQAFPDTVRPATPLPGGE